MDVALYRWGVMAQSNSSSDSSLDEESLRRTSAGTEEGRHGHDLGHEVIILTLNISKTKPHTIFLRTYRKPLKFLKWFVDCHLYPSVPSSNSAPTYRPGDTHLNWTRRELQLNYGIISSLNELLTFGTAWITEQSHQNIWVCLQPAPRPHCPLAVHTLCLPDVHLEIENGLLGVVGVVYWLLRTVGLGLGLIVDSLWTMWMRRRLEAHLTPSESLNIFKGDLERLRSSKVMLQDLLRPSRFGEASSGKLSTLISDTSSIKIKP